MINVLIDHLQYPFLSLLRRSHTAVVLASFPAAVVLSMLVGTDAAAQTVIWERGDQIVLLARQDDRSASPNDHPVNTEEDEVAAMLATLRVQFVDAEADIAPVAAFTREEIDDLGEAVATGLGQAAPSQDVIFHVIGARRLSPGAFGKRNRVTAGRIFYRDGEFNIIFGQIQTPHRKRNLYGQRDEDFYPRNYGSRGAETEHEFVLLTGSAAQLYQNDNGLRDDWIVIDRVAAAAAIATDKNNDVEPAPAGAVATASAGAAAASMAPPATVSESNETGLAQAEETNVQSSPSPAADVEERLTQLKHLRDLELITEEAYQDRMQEILQDL